MEAGRSSLLCIIAVLLLCASPLQATDDGLAGLTPGSPAAGIYGADHLDGLSDEAVLVFDYRFEGTLLEQPFDDEVWLDFSRHMDGRDFNVAATLFPATRNLEIGPISASKVNPILLIFFQRDVTQMSNGTGGSQHYFRNAIRRVLQTPAPGSQRATTIELHGHRAAAREISFRPFAAIPDRVRLRAYADKTYSFVMSDAVPGGIYEVRTETPEKDGAGVLLRESYRFREMRQ